MHLIHICGFQSHLSTILRSAVAFVWGLHPFYVYTFIFSTEISFVSSPIDLFWNLFYVNMSTYLFVFFCCWPLKLDFSVSRKGNKHTKKMYFCFTGSEAETHDVISEDNVIYFLLWNECLASFTLWEMGDKLKKLYAYLEGSCTNIRHLHAFWTLAL